MKKLKKIEKQNILNSSLWKPPNKNFDLEANTNSWFDLKLLNEESNYKIRFAKTSTIRSYPVLIFPNLNQKKILLEWNEIYRQVYNLTVSYLKTEKIKSFIQMRKIIDKKIIENKNLSNDCKKYGIPKHTRDNAIKDCLKAYETSFSNLANKNIKFFKIRYKRKDHHLSSIVLEPTSFSKRLNGFEITTLGEIKSQLPLTNISKESRLCYNSRTNTFVLRVPYEKITSQFVKRGKICSLDPGMRTFQTIYSPNNNCYEICTSDTNKQIHKLIKRIETPNKENPRYKKYQNRLREKLSNKIKDLHYKTCNFLCKSFETIIVGNMSTKSIISKDLNLNKDTKKYCVALSHYLFKQRLIAKGQEYGCKVEIVDESYTSKTCGGCGEINENLGSKKMFECTSCEYIIDRDINGARNILIKYLC